KVTLVIRKTDVDGISFAGGEFTYNGEPHSIYVVGAPADATVSYEGNGQVNAGTYTVKARVEQPDHDAEELEATLTIRKAQPVITAASVQTHVYDGTAKAIAATMQPAELQGQLQYSPQLAFTPVGSYVVRISVPQTANYYAA